MRTSTLCGVAAVAAIGMTMTGCRGTHRLTSAVEVSVDSISATERTSVSMNRLLMLHKWDLELDSVEIWMQEGDGRSIAESSDDTGGHRPVTGRKDGRTLLLKARRMKVQRRDSAVEEAGCLSTRLDTTAYRSRAREIVSRKEQSRSWWTCWWSWAFMLVLIVVGYRLWRAFRR